MSGEKHSSNDWVSALQSVQCAMSKLNCDGAVIGGIAVSLRARPRYTDDLDAVFWQGDHNLAEVLEALVECGLQPRSIDALKFAKRTRVFPLMHVDTGFLVDVSLGAIPFEASLIERADIVEHGGVRFRLPRRKTSSL